jgi:AhpD family alkylhydroperoxidase
MQARISLEDTPKGFMDGLVKTSMYLKKSGLDPKLIELLNYRVSQLNGCAYCLDMHHKDAVRLGETELRLHSLAAWQEAPYYSAKERAALSYAEALTLLNHLGLPAQQWKELSRHFSQADRANLTLAITQINTWNRINKAFGTVPGNYQPGEHDINQPEL